MEKIYVLPLQILAVIVTATIIGLIIRFFKKKKRVKKNSPRMSIVKPFPAGKKESDDYPLGV